MNCMSLPLGSAFRRAGSNATITTFQSTFTKRLSRRVPYLLRHAN